MSGQYGAQGDLRLVADEFMKLVFVPSSSAVTPSSCIPNSRATTLAGVSSAACSTFAQIWSTLTRLVRVSSDPLGRFAQNPDAHEGITEYGEQIIEKQIARIGELVDQAGLGATDIPHLTFDDVSLRGPQSCGSDPRGSATARSRGEIAALGPRAFGARAVK